MPGVAVAFPLHLTDGRTATVRSRSVAAEQLIEELLFTEPGARLNEPTLGCGLRELVFAPDSPELGAATQFQVATALQAWLGDVVKVVSVTVAPDAPQLAVTVVYELLPERVRGQVTVRA